MNNKTKKFDWVPAVYFTLFGAAITLILVSVAIDFMIGVYCGFFALLFCIFFIIAEVSK
jgi:hypothetical protein